MADEVTEVFAFVLANGDLTEELLFGEDEIPELRPDEIGAIDNVRDHVEGAFVGLLSACRAALWELAEGHAVRDALGTFRNRDATIWENESVKMPLVLGRSVQAQVGFRLVVLQDKQYHLTSWVWTQARLADVAREVVKDLDGAQDVNWDGSSHWIDCGTPAERESFAAVGASAAERLWNIARPIAEAILRSNGAAA